MPTVTLFGKVGRNRAPIFSIHVESPEQADNHLNAHSSVFIQDCIKKGLPSPSFETEIHEDNQDLIDAFVRSKGERVDLAKLNALKSKQNVTASDLKNCLKQEAA